MNPQRKQELSIETMHLYRGVRLSSNECPEYDIKQSDGEAPIMLGYPFIDIAPTSTWLRVVAPERVLSIGQIEMFGI